MFQHEYISFLSGHKMYVYILRFQTVAVSVLRCKIKYFPRAAVVPNSKPNQMKIFTHHFLWLNLNTMNKHNSHIKISIKK